MPKNKNAKKFRLFSAVLATVCIVLVGDAIAPIAAIGNSGYFWWIVLLIAFFIPYGLISSELSSQYPSEGGLYTWVKKAFGEKWAGRVAWYYWINFPLWIASLANLVTIYLLQIIGFEMTWPVVLAIQLGYILLVTVLGVLKFSQSIWVINLGAIVKFLFMAGLGGLGIYALITQGSANPVGSWTDLLPMISVDGGGISFGGLRYVSLIIFCMLGFEVVSSFGNQMQNPKKEIPRAILLGGILIAILYLLPSFAISVATPAEYTNLGSGMLDSYGTLLAVTGLASEVVRIVTIVVGSLFIYTLITNAASWTFGVNSVATMAAQDGVFPKSWAKHNKNGMPYVASIWTGIVAAVILTAGTLALELIFQDGASLFWIFFSLSLVTLLVSYLPMFTAFYRLHKRGPQTKTGYFVRGGKFKAFLLAFFPTLLLVGALFFTLFPEFNLAMFSYNWPLIAGFCLVIIIGEILASRAGVPSKQRSKSGASASSRKGRKSSKK